MNLDDVQRYLLDYDWPQSLADPMLCWWLSTKQQCPAAPLPKVIFSLDCDVGEFEWHFGESLVNVSFVVNEGFAVERQVFICVDDEVVTGTKYGYGVDQEVIKVLQRYVPN